MVPSRMYMKTDTHPWHEHDTGGASRERGNEDGDSDDEPEEEFEEGRPAGEDAALSQMTIQLFEKFPCSRSRATEKEEGDEIHKTDPVAILRRRAQECLEGSKGLLPDIHADERQLPRCRAANSCRVSEPVLCRDGC